MKEVGIYKNEALEILKAVLDKQSQCILKD